MKRLLPFLWLLMLLSLSCGPWIDGLWFPSTVRSRLARGAAQGPGTLVPLSETTPFGYKTAYIFGPSTKLAVIQSCLGLGAGEAPRLARGLERRDDIHLLIFWFEHVPPDSMEIPRSLVDFEPEVAQCACGVEDPVFVVKEGGRLGLAPGVVCEEPDQRATRRRRHPRK